MPIADSEADIDMKTKVGLGYLCFGSAPFVQSQALHTWLLELHNLQRVN